MRVRKAVVTAAGWGTRFLPATKAQPKEMMPLVDKPLIQYVIEEAVASGIEQIIVVTALGKRAIEDHFDRSVELENALQQRGDVARAQEVRAISELVAMAYVRQKEQLGLGHAVLTTRALVGDEPFALFLPDDIVVNTDVPAMQQLLDVYNRFGASVLAIKAVPYDRVQNYGVIAGRAVGDGVYQVSELVEKPMPAEAPSNLAIVGRYVLTPDIFAELERTPPGRNNEIQLTDGLRLLLQRQPIYACELRGTWHDTGTPVGLLKASVEMALQREDIGLEFRRYIDELCVEGGLIGP